MLTGKKITLLVTGSIAAYKSAELVRALKKAGAEVFVAMSQAATQFITPLTLQTLSGNPVSLNMFDLGEEAQIGHITLADQADLVLVAPATADTIAKARAGFADNIVHAVLLATKAPVIFAPAMNINMWQNISTQENVSALRERGAIFVKPGEGELACGWFGAGRFAELDSILLAAEKALSANSLAGCDVIVSAGPTRESLDPVRFLSNRSTGKMGYAIAKAAMLEGARVSLVSGPTELPRIPGVSHYGVETAEEMQRCIVELLYQPDKASLSEKQPQFLFMVAAVADLRAANVSREKIKYDKKAAVTLQLVPNEDILAAVGREKSTIEAKTARPLKIIGFAAETGTEVQLLEFAKQKLKTKNADLIVGNFAVEAFASENNRVWLVEKSGEVSKLEEASKEQIAHDIIAAALKC